MIILSLNIRGFGGPHKISSLKALFSQLNPDIFFIQETLVSRDKAIKFFLQCVPSWNVVALDPCGPSGGLLSGWNPTFVELYALDTLAGIYLEGRIKQSTDIVKLLNCYAPYKDRELLWIPIIRSGLLNEEGIIVGGDLNFTLSTREVWGDTSRIDTLSDFFTSLIQSSGLVDVQPTKLTPTCRNGRDRVDGMANRLDHFLLDDSLLNNKYKVRSWVINSTISDHNPIYLQLDSFSQKSLPPFKFNSTWINDQDFSLLIKQSWNSMRQWTNSSTIQLLCSKLNNLKRAVICWHRDKKVQLQSELLQIDSKKVVIFDKCLTQIFAQVDLETLKILKQEKEKILAIEENTWQLKSKAIWLNSGDKNTKFFHKYDNMIRTQNTIWDIEDDSGVLHTSDSEIKKIAMEHFKTQFRSVETKDTHCQLKVLEHLPNFFSESDCEEIGKSVTIDEVKETVFKMPKDKSLGPDGWTQELFQYFFEISGKDLHLAVEESRVVGFISGSLNATFFILIPKVNKPRNFHDFRPIVHCNFVYKVISKIIATRIKSKLAVCISHE